MSGGLFDKFKLSSPTQPERPKILTTGYSSQINDNSPKMDDATFRKFRDFIYQQCGIYYTENKKYLLEGRIAKRVDANNFKSFDEYYNFLSSPINIRKEMQPLFEVITINETYFFRNEPQFSALENIIAPEILKIKVSDQKRRFRIWSAASSSGEEPYTLAMIILEKFKPKYPQIQFEVVGSDISPGVLQTARSGVYREYSVRNMPKNYLQKYFTQDGDKYILQQEVRNIVKFLPLNLYDQPAMRAMNDFDVIFCCNVLIYFDNQSKQQVVSHLYDSLNKHGYLFIGYSESLHGISKAFRLIHFPKTIAYKKE